jgi:hypothetical protein
VLVLVPLPRTLPSVRCVTLVTLFPCCWRARAWRMIEAMAAPAPDSRWTPLPAPCSAPGAGCAIDDAAVDAWRAL